MTRLIDISTRYYCRALRKAGLEVEFDDLWAELALVSVEATIAYAKENNHSATLKTYTNTCFVNCIAKYAQQLELEMSAYEELEQVSECDNTSERLLLRDLQAGVKTIKGRQLLGWLLAPNDEDIERTCGFYEGRRCHTEMGMVAARLTKESGSSYRHAVNEIEQAAAAAL